MKKLSTITGLFLSLGLCAQYTPEQIKKFRISQVTKLSVTRGEENVFKEEIWYDEHGNDTAQFNNSELFRRTVYEYDSASRPLRKIIFRPDGRELSTAVYVYKADGNYTINNTDRDFGMTDHTFCNKHGKITKTVSPDETEKVYSYDNRGRLVGIKTSSPDAGGIITDIQYVYNSKNQLIREVSRGDYKWTRTYTYNAKGLIAKCKSISVTDDVADPEVIINYEYKFW